MVKERGQSPGPEKPAFLSPEYVERYKDIRLGAYQQQRYAQQVGEAVVELAVTKGRLNNRALDAMFTQIDAAEEALPNFFPKPAFSQAVAEHVERSLPSDKTKDQFLGWLLGHTVAQIRKTQNRRKS